MIKDKRFKTKKTAVKKYKGFVLKVYPEAQALIQVREFEIEESEILYFNCRGS